MVQRVSFYVAIAVLLAALAVAGVRLTAQYRAIQVAVADDPYWPMFQLETEIANLAALLADEAAVPAPNTDAIRFRADIALSRFPLVYEGLGAPTGELVPAFDALRAYETALTHILDHHDPLTPEHIATLRDLTAAIRPEVRRLSVSAVTLRAEVTETERRALATTFAVLAGGTLAFVGLLIAALIYLRRLLAVAQKKDTQIREASDRLASTVAASLDGIIIADAEGLIVEFNRAACDIFGWSRDEILGRGMDETIVPHHHRAAHSAGMQRYLDTRMPHVIDAGRLELSALRKSGEEFPIELNITSTRQTGQEFFIGYVRDISQQRIDAQKLIDARDSAEQADRAKSRFLTVMSHEMRTPLNGILGVLDLLMKTPLKPQQERYVQVAAASSEILLESVNEALDITRIEAGVMSLSPEPFLLRATVRRVADVLRSLAVEKGLTLEVAIDPGMDQEFLGDGGRINQILTNLIGNAIKFTDEGGIRVDVTGIHGPDETVASIVVSDTGPGIPPDMIDAIFEDFVALARPEGRQRRSDGLGLSIARKMARLMGGDLAVESAAGQGSAFSLKIPLRRVIGAQPTRVMSRSLPASAAKSVLIVEDNAVNRSVLKDMLIGLGHRVAEAPDGLAALKTAGKEQFDLIVMDISMPFMDGIEATRRIRTDTGPNQETYILGLTAHGREEFRSRARSAGMDGFCTKPIRLSELEKALRVDGAAPLDDSLPVRTVDDDVLGELARALGDQKLIATAEQFFDDLDGFFSSLEAENRGIDQATASATIHKMRGAAVMLGFNALDADLEHLATASKSQSMPALQAALNASRHGATQARDAFATIIKV